MRRQARRPEPLTTGLRPLDTSTAKFLPRTDLSGNEFNLERQIKPTYLLLPDLQTAPIGVRLRFLRKRRGLTIRDLEKATGVSHNAISHIESSATRFNVAAVGRLLGFLGDAARDVFPGDDDAYDQIIGTRDFGAWLMNSRLRRGLRQVDLARLVGISPVSLCRYERRAIEPGPRVLERILKALGVGSSDYLACARRWKTPGSSAATSRSRHAAPEGVF
ncbi:MAG: helix-turn-helix transcriptional regulator [Elusimicrobia bacterium]|nr:helix-turn-helix transcriptional regulator [Elusimicrobiota bacterium]MDE2424828.1 helix-turn-helix transcriptional regulator [Elusimicrobiota bacterium]